VLDVDGTAAEPITPEGLSVGYRGWAISPDGTMVAVATADGPELFPVGGGSARRLPGTSGSWSVVGWIESGLLISENPAAGGTVFQVDPTTGRREPWAEFRPQDPTGMMSMNLATLVTTPDGRGYGYTWHRAMSDLYLVRGWS
jgi:hypothetical protein